MGEAKNPGPGQLRCASVNLASWHRHGRASLEAAGQLGVDILLAQEAGLTTQAMAGAVSAARAYG